MFRWTTPSANPNGGGGAAPRGPEYAAVSAGHEVLAFGGGRRGDDRIHVRVFNTVSLRWRELAPTAPPGGGGGEDVPPYLTGHTAALIRRTVYFLGECGYPYRNVLHAFHVDADPDGRGRWSKPEVSGSVPAASYDHSACVLGRVMLVYGGRTWLTGYIMDSGHVYRLDTGAMVWSLIRAGGTAAPPVSDVHSATVVGTKMFVCGLTWNQGAVVRAFDTETDCWLSAPPSPSLPKRPSFRSTFARGGELYMFGDYARALWRLDRGTFSWSRVEPKGDGPPRPMFLACCCLAGDLVVLFGGDGLSSRLNAVLDLSPGLKTLCKLAVMRHGLETSGLPHDVRWELAALRPTGRLEGGGADLLLV